MPDSRYGPFHLAAATKDVFAVLDDADNVLLSTDAGRSWRIVLTLSAAGSARDQAQREIGLGFLDANIGFVIEPPDTVATTTDQGRNWRLVSVR